MVSRRAFVAVAILVTIGALGVGAATLPTLDSGDPEDGDGDGVGDTGESAGDLVISLPGWLATAMFALLLVLAAVAAVVLLRDGDGRFLRIMAVAVALGIFLLLLIELVDIPFSFEEQPFNETGDGGDERGENGDGGDGENGELGDIPTAPFPALLALVVAGLLGAALVYWRTPADPTERVTATDETETEALRQAARRAADRIEEDSFENGVYQAWYEMTAALSVSQPDSRTPEEFKQAAIAAGLARDDVEMLTALFQAVRYGNLAVTDDREQEAMNTLRRIADHRENSDEPRLRGDEKRPLSGDKK